MSRIACGFAVLLTALVSGTALALPPLPIYVREYYAAKPEYAKFSAAFGELMSKCDACHKPGADKKAKGHALNDFGEAVHKNLKDKDFLAANMGKDDPKMAALAKKLVADALAAAEAVKKDGGKTYGEIMKAGTLPGTNP